MLTRELAVTKAALTHEWRDNLIYGSQIELLRTLNAAPVGLGGAAIEPLYAKAAADWSIVYKNYPFQAWLDFLITGGLVHRQEDRFLISVLGRDYLSYLVATGRTGFRAF